MVNIPVSSASWTLVFSRSQTHNIAHVLSFTLSVGGLLERRGRGGNVRDEAGGPPGAPLNPPATCC